MYGATIPEESEDDAILSKQPRKNQPRVVVALCVGVFLVGALGTIVSMAGGPEAPLPSRAAMELYDPRYDECGAALNARLFFTFTGCMQKAKGCGWLNQQAMSSNCMNERLPYTFASCMQAAKGCGWLNPAVEQMLIDNGWSCVVTGAACTIPLN